MRCTNQNVDSINTDGTQSRFILRNLEKKN